MVLSHGKLKRKRREELAALEASRVVAPETSASLMDAPGAAEDEGAKKKRKEEKKKKRKMNDLGEGEVAMTPSNGAAGAVEEQALTEAMKKKEKKTKRKTVGNEAIDEVPVSGSVENGANHIDNRTDGAARDGGDKAEQPIVDNGAATASNERPMSVREKKGKKKGVKDRWGAKIAEDTLVLEKSFEMAAAMETPPSSNASAEELYDLKKVYVGGMPYYTTEDDIHDYFSPCGVISELDCLTFTDTGNFRGIAFITFKTEEAAAKSLEYDGADMGGRFLKIEQCKLKPRASMKDPQRGEVPKTPGSTSAYIGNLSWDITEDGIKNFFKKSYSNSKIDSIRLSFDKTTGEFKGFGHIDFGDDESLEAAVSLNQTALLGRPLKIAYAVPSKQRSGDGGNGNDRSESKRVGTCYNCGEEGHKSFLCQKKGAYGNAKVETMKVGACYSCGEEGHKSFLCPKKGAR